MRECEVCHRSIQGRRANARYCGAECRSRATSAERSRRYRTSHPDECRTRDRERSKDRYWDSRLPKVITDYLEQIRKRAVVPISKLNEDLPFSLNGKDVLQQIQSITDRHQRAEIARTIKRSPEYSPDGDAMRERLLRAPTRPDDDEPTDVVPPDFWYDWLRLSDEHIPQHWRRKDVIDYLPGRFGDDTLGSLSRQTLELLLWQSLCGIVHGDPPMDPVSAVTRDLNFAELAQTCFDNQASGQSWPHPDYSAEGTLGHIKDNRRPPKARPVKVTDKWTREEKKAAEDVRDWLGDYGQGTGHLSHDADWDDYDEPEDDE
jgi:hypothetical protein